MNKANPLERSHNDEDVEVFDPNTLRKNPDKERILDTIRDMSKAVETYQNSNPDKERILEAVRDMNNDFASVHGFDFSDNDLFEEPRLPEEGLRSRNFDQRNLCAYERENMKWSDWVSCLHARMGLPRWLTAATLSLGMAAQFLGLGVFALPY